MKNKKRNTISFLLLFLFSSLGYSQNYKPIKDVDALREHEEVLQEIRPQLFNQLKIESVYKIDDTHTAIGYLKGNTYSEVIVNEEQEEMLLVLSSVEVTKEKAPNVVYDVWQKKYSNEWQLDKILYSKTPYGKDYYTIVMYKITSDGEKHWDRVFYNELGHQQPPLI